MGVRNTSKAAFLSATESGLTSIERRRIYNVIERNPGITRREIYNLFRLNGELSSKGNEIDYSTVSARCTALKDDYELIYEEGCKKNPGTTKSANKLYPTRKINRIEDADYNEEQH